MSPRQWAGEPSRPADIDHVRRCGKTATAPGPVDNDAFWWLFLIACASCAIVACALGLLVIAIAKHWVGFAQIGIATLVVYLLALGVDRAYSAAIRAHERHLQRKRLGRSR